MKMPGMFHHLVSVPVPRTVVVAMLVAMLVAMVRPCLRFGGMGARGAAFGIVPGFGVRVVMIVAVGVSGHEGSGSGLEQPGEQSVVGTVPDLKQGRGLGGLLDAKICAA